MNSVSIYRVGVGLVSILGLFLAACGPMPAAALGNSRPCVPTAPEANIYRTGMQSQVKSLYSRRVQNQGNSDPAILQGLKNEAFTFLVDQVKRWTSAVDIPNDNTNVIRISLTFISPELVQIIILNHQLYKNVLSEIDFENILITKMYEIADQEELIFLMTITYSQYNKQIATETNRIMLSIPMHQLVLTNAENMQVIANQIDPPLRQEIVVSHSPSAGYIAFPIGVGTLENCTQVLDRRQNTVINVSTRGIRINGLDYAPQLSWSVKYHPLVVMDDGLILPSTNYTAPPEIPIIHLPPDPVRTIPADQVDARYWELMALHVWGFVTDP